MNRIFLSLVIGALVVGGLLVFQMTRATATTSFIPSELMSNPVSRSRVRLGGRVAGEHPIDYQVQPQLRLAFHIHDPGAKGASVSLPVIYHGVKPDMFAPGRDVILDGDFREGTFYASSLLTQCPSKYEAPSPEHQYPLTHGEPSAP